MKIHPKPQFDWIIIFSSSFCQLSLGRLWVKFCKHLVLDFLILFSEEIYYMTPVGDIVRGLRAFESESKLFDISVVGKICMQNCLSCILRKIVKILIPVLLLSNLRAFDANIKKNLFDR